ncbi:MAG: YheU family protein [Bdellovibrionota bacterium]
MNTNEELPPVLIEPSELSPDALDGIIDNFIMRDGTDYGTQEVSYETKVKNVRRQLERGDVKIIFDPTSESVTLVTKQDWLKRDSSRD